MADPIKFDDIALRKKISDKSVMHAYKSLIDSYRQYLSKSQIDGK